MPKLFSHFLLTPKDVGMEHYSVQEIAKMMEPVESVDVSSLYEFAQTINTLFETGSSSACKEEDVCK